MTSFAPPAANGPFSNLPEDTPIYRIQPQRYLKELLSGKLVLPATRLWTDPYENLISWCGYDFLGDDGKIKQVFLGNDRFPTFGQCWTATSESDALWRIYSRVHATDGGTDSFFAPEEGVRLRTTARKLVNCLAAGMGQANRTKCYIGRVIYVEEEQMRQRIANIVAAHRDEAFSDVAGHADALMIKRTPFQHESEIRLLYIDSDRKFEKQKTIEVPIDVNKVIDEITLDPRVRYGEHRRKVWLEENGFKNTINTSLLYLGVILVVPLYTPEELKQAALRFSGKSG